VFNENVFMSLAPYADDIWFYAMAILNGTEVRRVYTRNELGEEYIQNESVQGQALNHSNVAGGGNDSQLKSVFDKYGIFEILKKC